MSVWGESVVNIWSGHPMHSMAESPMRHRLIPFRIKTLQRHVSTVPNGVAGGVGPGVVPGHSRLARTAKRRPPFASNRGDRPLNSAINQSRIHFAPMTISYCYRMYPTASRTHTRCRDIMIRDAMTWLGGKDAAVYLGVSRDKVEIYALRWPQDGQHVPGRLRWKHLWLKPGSPPIRRYYRADLDAFRNFRRK
jgi:hypothetical protein